MEIGQGKQRKMSSPEGKMPSEPKTRVNKPDNGCAKREKSKKGTEEERRRRMGAEKGEVVRMKYYVKLGRKSENN